MTQTNYRYLTRITFFVLWLYVFLRAAWVAPLHDEVATYFHFIETGNFWGESALLDANNHLLNSFLGHWSYRLFGESFFLFRLPNVLCFVLYFWGIHHLLRALSNSWRYVCLVGITSIPYVLEYFAYTRGYGLSLTAFIWVLIFARKLVQQFSIATVAGLYAASYLAILANISFLTTSCLVLALTGVYALRHFRTTTLRQKAVMVFLTALYGLGCVPLVKLSMTMKAAGTLYYGSLDGLWDVTGKTLSRYVLFADGDWLCWVFGAVILGLLLVQLRKLFQLGLWQYLEQESGVYTYFFTGLLALILVMAMGFAINYPEDRVAMLFIPLFLLLVISSLYPSPRARKLLLLLLFFPLTLVWKCSLSTSVFTPDERMSAAFYTTVKQALRPGMTLSGYPTMQLTWALQERTAKRKDFLHLEARFQPTADIVLVKTALLTPQDDTNGYERFCTDPEAGYAAYRRKQSFTKKRLFSVQLPLMRGNREFLDLARFPADSAWHNKHLLITVTGMLQQQQPTEMETLVLSSTKKDGTPFRYEAFELRWHNGIQRLQVPFSMSYELTRLEPDEGAFCVYLWNKLLHPATLKNCTVTVFELRK